MLLLDEDDDPKFSQSSGNSVNVIINQSKWPPVPEGNQPPERNGENGSECNEPATTNGGGTGASQMTGPSTSTMSDRMEELKMGSLATGGTTSGKTTIEDRADENSRDRKIRTASSAPSKSRSSTPAATKGGNSGASSKTGPMKPTGNSQKFIMTKNDGDEHMPSTKVDSSIPASPDSTSSASSLSTDSGSTNLTVTTTSNNLQSEGAASKTPPGTPPGTSSPTPPIAKSSVPEVPVPGSSPERSFDSPSKSITIDEDITDAGDLDPKKIIAASSYDSHSSGEDIALPTIKRRRLSMTRETNAVPAEAAAAERKKQLMKCIFAWLLFGFFMVAALLLL
ncbi:hypothetical protein Bhyg_13967, partial [Pseudolycoriella hygida]